MAAALSKPAFAPNPRRRAMIAKVKIAQKTLGLTEEDYRATIHRLTGMVSAADCTEAQLEAVIGHFLRNGFTAKAKAKRPGAPRRADHPVARKARAMWISLGLVCAIRDHSEAALEGFAQRQLGCSTLQWADQSQGGRLIEALKARAERHGWGQSLEGLARVHHVHALKRRLCDAILAKLKATAVIPAKWELGEAAWKLCQLSDPGQFTFDTDELDQIANGLGRVLRAKGGEAAFDEVKS